MAWRAELQIDYTLESERTVWPDMRVNWGQININFRSLPPLALF